MGITVPIEEIRRCRRELSKRGYKGVVWVRPEGVVCDDEESAPVCLGVDEFRRRWITDYQEPYDRYCELMVGHGKPRPKISSARFHDHSGKPMRDEAERMDPLTEEQVAEVWDLRARLVWAHYRELIGEEPAAVAIDNPAGFIMGVPYGHQEGVYDHWCMRNRGKTFGPDFQEWLEVVHV